MAALGDSIMNKQEITRPKLSSLPIPVEPVYIELDKSWVDEPVPTTKEPRVDVSSTPRENHER